MNGIIGLFLSSRPPAERVRVRYLLIVPVLISGLAACTFLFHGDVNASLLYSQCHARSRLPEISRVPVLGAPLCYLVSLFMFATGPGHGIYFFGWYLSFLGALLTVSRVEAARECNKLKWSIRSPTASWLVSNLIGGAFVWNLWIIPTFIKSSRDFWVDVRSVNEDAQESGQARQDRQQVGDRIDSTRSLTCEAEVYAIIIAVAVGYMVPSVLMLTLRNATSVMIWLIFPLWVAVVHWVVKFAATRLLRNDEPHCLRTHDESLWCIYFLPGFVSFILHVTFVSNLGFMDDSRQMTQMALKFILINFLYTAALVYYWMFVDVNVDELLPLMISSLLFGPGATLCIRRVAQENKQWLLGIREFSEETDDDDSTVHEDTPLLG
ncbi:hypothetical protein F5B22DRAFT_589770 [Xylaria bambusicola]|uniref:uncharacterized protein n=1 Tax=Xylaria bambusicola TaxID=326684 RepID=UPI002007306A|nr:uncharacterized protein F5B22DRAFT_589770 [Xylaria bambusicola]KAI0525400.1 hypothetical protein F5B22DRAFT_589770 [Xylaria bambusicola]